MGSLPFTETEFLEVFARYNRAVGPAPIALTIMAVLGVVAALRGERGSRWPVLLLAGLWAWSGAVYHLAHFRAINPAATLFGALFLGQAALFVGLGLRERPLRLRARPDARGALGGLLALYAMVLYPLLGWLLGGVYPRVPTFGAPCPVVILTFGLLLWSEDPVPWWIVPIPLGWSLLGGWAAVSLGIGQDLGLLLAGPLATVAIALDRRRRGGTGPARDPRRGRPRRGGTPAEPGGGIPRHPFRGNSGGRRPARGVTCDRGDPERGRS